MPSNEKEGGTGAALTRQNEKAAHTVTGNPVCRVPRDKCRERLLVRSCIRASKS